MAEVYDTTRFGQLYYASRQPTTDQLGLAAKYVTALLDRYQLQHAIIGGWAVFLRGGGRRTLDVDLTVATTMTYLKQVLCADHRICFPATHGLTSVQIFVWIGRSYDTGSPDTPDYAVSMDLLISGNLGTPSDLNNAREQIHTSVSTSLGNTAIVLTVYYQLWAKLSAFSDRGTSSENDFQDLVFLLNKHADSVRDFRHNLDINHRRTFYNAYAIKYVGYTDAIDSMKQLLGV